MSELFAQSLAAVSEAFARVEKPPHFCNHNHCSECAEHDQTLCDHTRESISYQELGNAGWDPICFINSDQGFQYYLPALARLATKPDDEYYLDQFLFHLNDERIDALTDPQRSLLAKFLEELLDHMPDEIDNNLDADETLRTIIRLRLNES